MQKVRTRGQPLERTGTIVGRQTKWFFLALRSSHMGYSAAIFAWLFYENAAKFLPEDIVNFPKELQDAFEVTKNFIGIQECNWNEGIWFDCLLDCALHAKRSQRPNISKLPLPRDLN